LRLGIEPGDSTSTANCRCSSAGWQQGAGSGWAPGEEGEGAFVVGVVFEGNFDGLDTGPAMAVLSRKGCLLTVPTLERSGYLRSA